MEERVIKIARLRPGKPFEEIGMLSVTVGADIEGYFLKLHQSLEDPSLAEYWFESMELIERQARTLFGERFPGWEEISS